VNYHFGFNENNEFSSRYRIPTETQKVKRRRLFLDEGVTADENRQTGEILERASTSKSDDALEGQNYVEQSKVPQQ
jgi:hypothetical protein